LNIFFPLPLGYKLIYNINSNKKKAQLLKNILQIYKNSQFEYIKNSQIHLLGMEGVDVQLFVNILQIKLRHVHIHG